MALDLDGLRRAVELKDVYIVGAEDDTLELLLAHIAELEARCARLDHEREEAYRWVRA